MYKILISITHSQITFKYKTSKFSICTKNEKLILPKPRTNYATRNIAFQEAQLYNDFAFGRKIINILKLDYKNT